MRRYFILLLLFLWGINSLFGQTGQSSLYQSFLSGNMSQWKTFMTTMAGRTSLSDQEKLELIRYYYGYIGYSLGIKNKEEAQVYVNKGNSLIDELIKNKYALADVYALKGAFIGFRIAISPYKAPFIGKSSSDNVNKALSLDMNNIQANIERGNILYYSPSAFGGDKNEAKKYYSNAISLFEKNASLLKQNWIYLNLLTGLAKIYTQENKYTDAKQLYEKILKIEPEYQYVKNELYPDLLKKM